MEENAGFFDRVVGNPLTVRQREAILTNEDTTLVVAGAGTGKTSVIVGKVGWLLHHGLAQPDEILVLAYNRLAADEVAGRLKEIPGAEQVTATTMHAFGLSLLAKVRGTKPSLSPLAEDRWRLARLIRDRLKAMLADPDQRRVLLDLATRHLEAMPDFSAEPASDNERRDIQGVMASLRTVPNQPVEIDERSAAEWAWLLRHGRQARRDLTGIRMRSRQEVKIANWLTLNGIRWEYERSYTFSTATAEHRQYKPDFYLPDHDLWIEHYGVGRHGETVRNIDRQKYADSMAWKRRTHLSHGTRCIETFSYQDMDGTLFPKLEARLRKEGVAARPLTAQEIARLVDSRGSGFDWLVTLIGTACGLHRGNGKARESVVARASTERDHRFLEVLFAVVSDYEAVLRQSGEIDFDDMILRAREYLRSGAAKPSFRYILVDEFQDIIENRLGLLQDLRRHVPHVRLFVVGDDWQSIYRFNGSDVGLMIDLAKHVGATARVDLDVTFRYGPELLKVSSDFIQKNPAQLRKTMHSSRVSVGASCQPICVIASAWTASEPKPTMRVLRDVLNDIHRRRTLERETNEVSVLVLGRYNATEPEGFVQLQREAAARGIGLTFSTVHRAKGMEADYVVLLRVTDGFNGFPAEIEDDPVLRLFTAVPDSFPNAEERRLFYVAITRARRRVYITTFSGQHSRFIDEDLLADDALPFVERCGDLANRYRCPDCGELSIVKTEHGHGFWWRCIRYPRCTGQLPRCPMCVGGGLETVSSADRQDVMVCTECQYVTPHHGAESRDARRRSR
ncbi:MAG: UvrD-helicase domain-containing protein [Thermomicrobiales bacterium]